MLMSELSRRTGVGVPTLKFYLREGLLPPGEALSQTRAAYDESHVRRVGIIRALTETVGLSVQQARGVLAVVDDPGPSMFDAFGRALAHLPPTVPEADDYPRARDVIERLGWVYDPRYVAVRQLDQALAAADALGVPLDADRLEAYAPHVHAIAAYDIARIPADPDAAIEYAVLGTAAHEPVLAALRRLAHQDVAAPR
ncbi:MerR family transcriptional regulator [Protaetiibacter mangrovi]|uniref:MerR family transcriptional regulator n=1 Tax=Protaetiibacter mangrovi TaxID=2970926 RepID=A0ABT1ZFV5_9MICO|nr:MerR family transcriptional regulator [Protaetiibacter mangrovi]MCS0499591.1 MerR family transcriptional regulator [Protaetiibacter mangrovi]TPX03378.1 MerR family transcriptional regulator [Schumannella luteola]